MNTEADKIEVSAAPTPVAERQRRPGFARKIFVHARSMQHIIPCQVRVTSEVISRMGQCHGRN